MQVKNGYLWQLIPAIRYFPNRCKAIRGDLAVLKLTHSQLPILFLIPHRDSRKRYLIHLQSYLIISVNDNYSFRIHLLTVYIQQNLRSMSASSPRFIALNK
jgi:hypothetical protein